ncbi:MAG: RluA family pseudouridine synthase [Eubacteriales bacterium]|nr:RluA family pseudouridine synthase [Eubacteriales bacterium]
MKRREIKITKANKERLDRFISPILSDSSRSQIQKLIRTGAITVNGNGVRPSFVPQVGDVISIICETTIREVGLAAVPLPLEILYEDEALTVINKPAGLVVHPGAGEERESVAAAVLAMYGEEGLSHLNGPLRPGIVHRLDKDTSGVLIICKTDQAHEAVAAQLANRSVERGYIGIVQGLVNEAGVVDAPIARHPKARMKMAVISGGREAITRYEPKARDERVTLMHFFLETGRTHQIRVHMRHIGHPIIADPIYGFKKTPHYGLERQALHARMVGFKHPITNKAIRIYAPVPPDLAAAADRLGYVDPSIRGASSCD